MVGWDICKDWMYPDGALRDIIIPDTSSDDWDCFLAAVRDWDYRAEFVFGSKPMDIPLSYGEIVELQNHDPTLLKLFVGSLQVNCHFFAGPEIEFDIDPREVRSKVEFDQLLEFIEKVGQLFSKRVLLTMENTPGDVIIQYEPTASSTEFYPLPPHPPWE